jgi:hypothetical protein
MRLEDVQAGEARRVHGEGAVVVDGLRDGQVVRAAEVEVVLAMAGRDVDEAGAGLGGDEVAGQQGHVEIVAARRAADGRRWRRRVPPLEHAAQRVRADAGFLLEAGQQRKRDQQQVAHLQQRGVGHALHMHQRVVDLSGP